MEYGTAFTSDFKSDDELQEAKIRWSQRLAGLTRDQLSFGVKEMTVHHKTFAPNLTEFIDICLSNEPAHSSHRMITFEPVVIAEKDSAKKSMESIMDSINNMPTLLWP